VYDHEIGLRMALDALRLRAVGDIDGSAQAVRDMVELGGMGYLFSACGVWAEAFNRLMHEGDGPAPDPAGPWHTFQVRDRTTGEPIDPDAVNAYAEGRPLLWAVRFITATANRDLDTMGALFSALCHDDEDAFDVLAGGVVQVLDLTASITRACAEREGRQR
jgi:hypothetical protein